MDDYEKFRRGAEEAQDLSNRLVGAFPKRRNMALLKARFEANDPNVGCKNFPGEERDAEYYLKFTDAQKQSLIAEYLRVCPKDEQQLKYQDYVEDLEHAGKLFVKQIERCADDTWLLQTIEPEDQKTRQRSFDPITSAIEKLGKALSALDSEALGYWYAHVVDAVAPIGISLSPSENQITSMLDNHFRAVVQGGEFRQFLQPVLGAIEEATKSAKNTLPLFDWSEVDAKFSHAKSVEQLIVKNGIQFSSAESGFAAICLRAMYELVGFDVEKVAYRLKKAVDHPESETKFRQKMQDRMNGG